MRVFKFRLSLVLVATFALAILFFAGFSESTFAVNDAADKACEGLSQLGVTCDSSAGSAEEVAKKPIEAVVGILSFVVGVACVLMIIYGAFRVVTSGGNSDTVKSGRSTIIYALIGLMLVLLANVIVSFTYKKAKEIESNKSVPLVVGLK